MALSRRTRLLATGLLVITSAALAARYENSFSFERPLQALIIILFVAGVLLFAAGILLRHEADKENGLLSVFTDGRWKLQLHTSLGPTTEPDVASPILSWHRKHILHIVIVTCVVLRAEILRRIVQNVECSHETVEPLLLILLALRDVYNSYFAPRSSTPTSLPGQSVAGPPAQALLLQTRYLIPAIISFTGIWLSGRGLIRSTYICPLVSTYSWRLQLLQYFGVILEAIAIECFAKISSNHRGPSSRLSSLSDVVLYSAYGLALTCSVVISTHQDWRSWAFGVSLRFLLAALLDGLLLSVFLFAVCIVSSEFGITHIAVTTTYSCFAYQRLVKIWTTPVEYPQSHGVKEILSIILVSAGMVTTIGVEAFSELSKSTGNLKAERRFWSLLILLLAFATTLKISNSDVVSIHTIDDLMKTAKTNHDEWLKQASSSKTLQEAVSAYKARYQRHPPPHFDKWFEFAAVRKSVIVDDYDRIWEDLQPFMTIEPSVLRNATDEMLSNQWNEIAGLSIRNGTMHVSPHIIGTHRWMLDGITGMIQNFVEWLPDMDLGFNINDECRVVVPWDDISARRRQNVSVGTKVEANREHGFSNALTALGQPLWMNESATLPFGPTKLFSDYSFRRTFHSHAAVSCPPNARARNQFHWNRRTFIAEFTAPYSSGQFLRNWTRSNDMCFQPDMADYHGFHLSPASFKTSYRLLPVFSQSKVQGYNDILFPSPWNYADKVLYNPEHDMPFVEKHNTLFWRGATSEGHSSGGTWQGMQRQRFVHLANNTTDTTLIPLLLPDERKYKHRHVPFSQVKQHLNINAQFVDHIQRCSRGDCETQTAEFHLAPKSDFQDHWKYKFLADFDGAGFSGRFLPFLQSGSLPFKAGLFREWYDDRLAPWVHFVPVDSRLQGLYAALAYFAGWGSAASLEVPGGSGESRVNRSAEAAFIAEQGSQWAKKVLRKQDMEIYFFRLLLEYGRLVDDKRDEIGFLL